MVLLTERDQALLADLARFGVLTTEQVSQRHFAGVGRKTCQNRLCELATAGYLERRAWGYDHGRHRHRAGWLLTQRGLRATDLAVPLVRRRESVLASLPHDATVADVAARVLADLSAAGIAAEWITERELVRGVPWLPPGWAVVPHRRPDGVLLLPEGQRVAVEVDTTQHSAHALAHKVVAYRQAICAGVYQAIWWFAASGGALAAERAIREHGDAATMAARSLPPGVSTYR